MTSNAPANAERDKLVVAELKRLHGAVDRQMSVRDALAEQLTPVVMPESPQDADKGIGVTGVPLADEIASVIEKIMDTNDILEGLWERLEI